MRVLRLVLLLGGCFVIAGCSSAAHNPSNGKSSEASASEAAVSSYLDYSGLPEQSTGGTRMIPIETPYGEFEVWTRRVGNNPDIKMLTLHGGPGGTHEILFNFDGYLPAAGIEYYYYDQLGSYHSDQPDDDRLWRIDRFVDEVEQVRKALGLNSDNFYLYGQSWGAILAIEYALEYPGNIKGLILSNMMASIPEYNQYAEEVLMPAMDPDVLDEIQALEAAEDYTNPRYEELMFRHYYTKHLLREPLSEWPRDLMLGFEHLNYSLYLLMQGPSELGASGRLEHWDRTGDLRRISAPTLVIGAEKDTMDPDHLRWMAEEIPDARSHICPDSGHITQYDAPDCYFPALIQFVQDVDAGKSVSVDKTPR